MSVCPCFREAQGVRRAIAEEGLAGLAPQGAED